MKDRRLYAKVIGSLALSAASLVGGCAMPPPMPGGIDRNLVAPPSITKGYILPQEVEYKIKRGVGVLWTERLKAGEYKPVLSNDKGTFYLGPPMAVTRWLGEKELGPNNGGFWISKDETQKPRLWFYFDATIGDEEAQRLGYGSAALLAAIFEIGKGSLTVWNPIEDENFAAKLQPIQVRTD